MYFTPMQINLLGFKVNAIDNTSVVNAGPVQYIDQLVSYKRNQSVAEINGDFSPVNMPFSILTDPDVADSNTVKSSAI
ncbi:hypothetical protein LKX83_09440 [Cohnella sp. REN36]|nr:hypothetical protein [Cohnella sp. REN36]